MAQTPIVGRLAVSPVPTTGSGIGYDGTASGSPETDIQAELDRLEALIAASPSGDFLTSNYGEQAQLVTVAAAGAAYTIDCSLGNTFDITLTANLTLSISNPAPPGVDSHIIVVLRQGGSGSYTVTWPASVKWQSATGTNTGSAPTLWTAVGAQDVIELSTLDGGTTWGGSTDVDSTLTIKDEGTPLATAATSLDFVGAGVVASGTGAAKTITIAGYTLTAAAVSALGFVGPILISNTPSTPLVFADLLQNEAQDDLLYADL